MNTSHALIGYTGFVGQTLLKQKSFTALYRSTNINHIQGQEFDLVVCAGVSAKKWLANLHPNKDIANIQRLIEHLKTIRARRFILISTVDVFKKPSCVTEKDSADDPDTQAYGLNRRVLEKFVEQHFDNHLIVRLPGLVGPGLQKNVIFDFHHDHQTDKINSADISQFYPMVNCWPDIEIALENQLQLIHLTAAPISNKDVAREGFGISCHQSVKSPPICYDLQTIYAHLYGRQGCYQYDRTSSLLAIRAYAQSEPKITPDTSS